MLVSSTLIGISGCFSAPEKSTITPSNPSAKPIPRDAIPQSFALTSSGSGGHQTIGSISLQDYQALRLTISCDSPIYIVGKDTGNDGLLVVMSRLTGGGGAEFKAEWIESSEVQKAAHIWQANVTYSPDIAGTYEFTLMNTNRSKPVRGEYILYIRS
jgi:hypothetical protein